MQPFGNRADIWFYEAAQAIGIEKMREVAARFGFGESVIQNFYDQSSASLALAAMEECARGRELGYRGF